MKFLTIFLAMLLCVTLLSAQDYQGVDLQADQQATLNSNPVKAVPKGFQNRNDSARLKKAWKGKVLKVSYSGIETMLQQAEGEVWEFIDENKAKVYIIQRDGTKVLKFNGPVKINEHVRLDKIGHAPGDYVLDLEAGGHQLNAGFKQVLTGDLDTFTDTSQRTYTLETP